MSLRSLVFATLAAGLLAFLAVIAVTLPPFAAGLSAEVSEREARMKTRSLSQELARRLHADWEEITALARVLPDLPEDLARAQLEGYAGGGSVSWVGYADLDGIVRIAAGGVLEGRSVEGRPWFDGGLLGGFAGDVHKAVLLQSILAPDAAEPLRFIDLALPVRDADGEVTGVLGVHINAEWLQRLLSEAAEVRGIDVVLVSADGSVAASTLDLSQQDAANRALRAAAAGAEVTVAAEWSDGAEAIAAVLTEVGYADLPSFGWRLVGRMEVDSYEFLQDAVEEQAVTLAFVVAAIFLLMALLIAVLLRPVTALTDSAERISRGEIAYPPETRTSHEARRLSAALARISGRAV